MATIAILPARGGSKRIKNKNIIDFCGKPMIAYALEAASKSIKKAKYLNPQKASIWFTEGSLYLQRLEPKNAVK